jgi:hypothetical protein
MDSSTVMTSSKMIPGVKVCIPENYYEIFLSKINVIFFCLEQAEEREEKTEGLRTDTVPLYSGTGIYTCIYSIAIQLKPEYLVLDAQFLWNNRNHFLE